MVPLKIQLKDDLPVCHQIIQAVRQAIFSAQLKDGAAFPSVRELSRELHISCATAHKAITALKDSGHLASRPGIGMVVTVPLLPPRDERLQRLEPHCAGLLNEAGEVQLKFSDMVQALRRTPRSAPVLFVVPGDLHKQTIEEGQREIQGQRHRPGVPG